MVDEHAVKEVLTSAVIALKLCVNEFFRNVHILLTPLANFPITTATVERSFSMIKRVTHFSKYIFKVEKVIEKIMQKKPLSGFRIYYGN